MTSEIDVLSQRIDEVSDGVIGVYAALLDARFRLGEKYINMFLDKIPERGNALYDRFKTFRDKEGADPATRTFLHFIASVIMPNPFSE